MTSAMLRFLGNRMQRAFASPVVRATTVSAAQMVRWKSSEAVAYKAAILQEFNTPLTVERITNRTRLGDGMVSLTSHKQLRS